MGVFSIRKRKKILRLYPDGSLDTRNLRVDYKSTVALWRKDEEAYIEHKKIYYLNKHTDRYYYKFYWDKTICVTPNNSVYAFKPAKSLKLNPGDEILTTNLEYGAADKAWEYYCKKAGAKYVRQNITLPVTTKEKFIEDFFAGLSPKTKLWLPGIPRRQPSG